MTTPLQIKVSNIACPGLGVLQEREAQARMLRVMLFLQRQEKPVPRKSILHWCSYPVIHRDPITPLVMFENDVLRLNKRLKRYRRKIVGSTQYAYGNQITDIGYQLIQYEEPAEAGKASA